MHNHLAPFIFNNSQQGEKVCRVGPFSTKLLHQKAVSSENSKGKDKRQGKLQYLCYK